MRVIQDDTGPVAPGVGTSGSRSFRCAARHSMAPARHLAANLESLAADLLRADTRDLEIADRHGLAVSGLEPAGILPTATGIGSLP